MNLIFKKNQTYYSNSCFFKIFVKKMLLPCGSSFWHKEFMLDRVSGSDSFQARAVPVIVIPAVPNYVFG